MDCVYIIGISSQKEIGVDIEQINSDVEVKKIASEIMHEDELVYFSSLRNIDRLDYFYQLWSGKESLIKAFGKDFYYTVTKIKLMANKMGIVKYEDNQFQYFLSDEIDNYALAVSYEK